MRRAADRSLIRHARELHRDGLVVGSVGNLSFRVPEGVRITPTRLPYDRMSSRDLVTVDLDGEPVRGTRAPSRELALHLAVYRARPDVSAIVHAHSPHAVAWSFLGSPLTPAIEEQEYYEIGEVRVTDPAPAGSPQLARDAPGVLGASNAVLLGRHGVLAVGPSLADAVLTTRVVEHHAQIALHIRAALGSGRAPETTETT